MMNDNSSVCDVHLFKPLISHHRFARVQKLKGILKKLSPWIGGNHLGNVGIPTLDNNLINYIIGLGWYLAYMVLSQWL